MTDLRERFRVLDRLEPPDVWTEAERRQPGTARTPERRGRALAAVIALAVAVAGFAVAVRAFSNTTPQRHPGQESPIPSRANGAIWALGAGGEAGSLIYAIDPTTGQKTPLWSDGSNPDATGFEVAPSKIAVSYDYAFSPDGSKVAFSAYVHDGAPACCHTEIFAMDADGSDLVQITHDGAYDSFPSWSPDGSELVFASYRGTAYGAGCSLTRSCPQDLYVIGSDGGDERQLTSDPADEATPAWSPDGSTIAYIRSEGGPSAALWLMQPDGSGARELVRDNLATLPQWSPDGTRILFLAAATGSSFRVLVVNADGTDAHQVIDTHADTPLGRPSWSPDGSAIAYGKSVSFDSELWTARSDGSKERELTSLPTYGIEPLAWRPVVGQPTPAPSNTASATVNGLLAFGAGTGIYTMNPDGSNLTELQVQGAVAYYGPEWSPDGTRMAFYGYPKGGGSGYGGGADYDIFVMNADGSGLTNLTTSPDDVRSGFSQTLPRWSPDGSRITYDGDDGLYVMNADGSNQTRVASGQDPSWSPDGSRIAFEGPGGAIWSVAPDGAGLTQLTSGAGFDGFPAYSPDGTKIAYYHGEGDERSIVVMNSDGSDPTVVASFQADTMGRPVWSPDGSEIAFDLLLTSYAEHGTWDVYVANADGSGVVDLTPTPGRDENTPVWAPDGTKIVFEATDVVARDIDNTGTFDIYVMNPDGSAHTRLTTDVHSMGFDLSWQAAS